MRSEVRMSFSTASKVLLWLGLVSYLVNHLVGSILFYTLPEFREVVNTAAGLSITSGTLREIALPFWVLSAAPILVVAGYMLPKILPLPNKQQPILDIEPGKSPGILYVFGLAVVAIYLATRFTAIGAFGELGAWLGGYSAWISARVTVNSGLFLFDQLLMYIALPTLFALSIFWLLERKTGIFLLSVIIPIIVLHSLIFQKKQGIVVILLITIGLAIKRWIKGDTKLAVFWTTAIGGILILFTYASLTLLVSGNSWGGTDPIPDSLEQSEERRANFALFLLSTVFARSASPAIYYLIHYGRNEKQPLDLPFDGKTTTDNFDVAKFMFPQLTDVSVSASYQFNLFSQGGLPLAIFGSVALGVFLRLLLIAIYSIKHSSPELFSLAFSWLIYGVVLVFSESLRETFLSSYGALWGIGITLVFANILKFRESKTASNP